MNDIRLRILVGLLLTIHLLAPNLAQAGLLEALRSVGDTLTKITSPHLVEFKKLVETENTEQAVALYAKEKDYFASLKDDSRLYVDDVLAKRDRRYRAELGEVRASLVLAAREEGEMRRWSNLKAALKESYTSKVRLEELAAPGPLMTEGLKSLQATIDGIQKTLQQDASRSLLSYGLFTEPSFSTKYPIEVRWGEHGNFSGIISTNLGNASIRQLEMFRKSYADTLIPAMGLQPKLNELYVTARLRESRANSYLAKRLVRDRLVNEGWVAAEKAGNGVLLAIWPIPQSDNSTYQVRPPSSVRHQMLRSDQSPTDFIASGGSRGHELVVFLRHEPIRMDRVISSEQQVNSQYKNGTRRLQNPDYARAQQALSAAYDQLQTIRQTIANSSATNASSTLGALAALVSVATESAAENDVNKAQRKLDETPQLIEEAVLLPYNYTTKTVILKHVVITNYAIFDTGTNKVSVGSVEQTWTKSFGVADRVREDDPSFAASAVMKSTKAAQDWSSALLGDDYEDIWKAVFSDYQKNSLGI